MLIYNITIDTINATAEWVSPMIARAIEKGAAYQWVDCNNNNAIIQGATDRVYTAPINGDYACIVSKGGVH